MTESIDLVAITTTLHFHSYGIRAGDDITRRFFPVEGVLSIKEIKDPFAEDQTSKLSLDCEGISIYVDGVRYWMTSCFADLDENRLLCMRDKDTLEPIVIGKVPEFSDPMDALNKMEALLHDLVQPKDTPPPPPMNNRLLELMLCWDDPTDTPVEEAVAAIVPCRNGNLVVTYDEQTYHHCAKIP